MDRIYLIGYMASGKSTVGKELAKQQGWTFIDLDELIMNRSGLSIPEIFRRYGEGIFRQLESSALVSTLEMKKTVIATGGGAPCYNDNMDIIKQSGTSIFLKGSINTIVKRLQEDTSVRPIIKEKNEEELQSFIEEHLVERMSFYNQADFTINIDQPISTIVDDILGKVGQT